MGDEQYAASRVMTENVCPVCHPERDWLRELLVEHYCGEHQVIPEGDLDRKMAPHLSITTGGGEADGRDCRAAARGLRR